MDNNLFHLRTAALNHLKTIGFKSKFTAQDIKNFEYDDTERLWTVGQLFC